MYFIKTIQRGKRPINSRSTWHRKLPGFRYPSIPMIGNQRFTPAQNIKVTATYLKRHRRILVALIESGIVKVFARDTEIKVDKFKTLVEQIDASMPEPKVEEPKVEEPKVEEPKVEEPKVEEPKVEEPKVEEPDSLADLRNRDDDGTFVGDDPETPENEAWKGGAKPELDPEVPADPEPGEIADVEAHDAALDAGVLEEIVEPEPEPEDDAAPSFPGPMSIYTKMNKKKLIGLLSEHFDGISDEMTKKQLLAVVSEHLVKED